MALIPSPNEWPPSYQGRDAYEAWLTSGTTVSGVDYEWVTKYAEKLWQERLETYRSLDEKADSIIRFFGSGAALLALGLLTKSDSINRLYILESVPSFLVAVFAILMASAVKRPYWCPQLPPVVRAKAYAEVYNKQSDGRFLFQMNLACEDLRFVCGEKAKILNGALRCSVFAIFLLILPLAHASISALLPVPK